MPRTSDLVPRPGRGRRHCCSLRSLLPRTVARTTPPALRINLGPRTSDLGPRTSDLGPRTSDLGLCLNLSPLALHSQLSRSIASSRVPLQALASHYKLSRPITSSRVPLQVLASHYKPSRPITSSRVPLQAEARQRSASFYYRARLCAESMRFALNPLGTCYLVPATLYAPRTSHLQALLVTLWQRSCCDLATLWRRL